MNNLFDTENQVLNPELIQKLNDLYDQGNLQLEKVKQNNVDYSLPIWNASKIMDSEVVNKLKETGSVLAYNHEKKTFEVIKIQGTNLGSGEGVYKDTKGIALQFKSIKGGKNAKVTTVGDELVVDAEYEYNDQGLKSLIDTKALKNHDHPIYATKPELKVLSNEVKTKADKSHEHQDYAKKDDLKALKTSIKIPKVDLSPFAKKSDLKSFVQAPVLSEYAKKSTVDLVVKESIKLNSNINSELKNYAKRDHLHDEYAKDAELKLLETKIPKDFATKKDIADLNYEKANLIHGHNTGQISGLTETLSGLGSTYLKIDGSNSMTSTSKITNLNADLFDGANLSTDGTFASNSDLLIPTEKATKTYVGANLWTLALGSPANGLTLTGTSTKTLSLSETGLVKLDGLSLKSDTSAVSKQLIFGADPSGGIRMLGGQTDGGLSMNDGILEYWNNWRGYVSAVAGRLQGIFRFDTRAGYQSEGFVVGGTTTGGTDFMGVGINYDYGDVNLAYYGVGSVAIGTHTGAVGIAGTNGNCAIYNDLYLGRDIVIYRDGMKIGTATSQPLAFWNKTPIVQPTTSSASATFASGAGSFVDDESTFDGYTIGQVVKALIDVGLLA